ncbi:MAG: alpha-glucan family phosphorylase [Bernardetiaceae bacterium]
MQDNQKYWNLPFTPQAPYQTKVAYFSMEFAVHQALKIYSGGLGFLAGSHMRSAYELQQNVLGIGMLWKYGYYDQVRRGNRYMESRFIKKFYSFLEPTDIVVPVYIDRHLVHVKALYLPPEVFGTAPLYLLTTDFAENDYLARTITHKLYDSETNTRIAQNIVLGAGGAKVVEKLGGADIYHLNEAHALPLAFHLLSKYQDVDQVRKHLVFTTHTPEAAGNEVHSFQLLERMGFFSYQSTERIRQVTGVQDDLFNHTLVALRLAKKANGVSKMHGEVARQMWKPYAETGIAPITHITNAQNKKYWADRELEAAVAEDDTEMLIARKKELKTFLFNFIANQTGKLFDENVLTLVWARRFAAYKRADLMLRDAERFERLLQNTRYPIQIIWAGKPYPTDQGAVHLFNTLMARLEKVKNCTILTGYELYLSRLLKQGADVWLNTPRIYREASGTSGMTAAMNGAVNFSIPDGWIPEYAEHGKNSFLIPQAGGQLPNDERDRLDCQNLYEILENEILPTYYDHPEQWWQIVKTNISTITPAFGANRMADQYYQKLYDA